MSPVSPKHPFHTCPNGSSVKGSSIQRPCNLPDKQCFTELNNSPLQITDISPPGLAASLYGFGGVTPLRSILHPGEGWGTNDLTYPTDSGIDLLKAFDTTISQSSRGANWDEIDAPSAPDPGDITSKELLQNKTTQFAW